MAGGRIPDSFLADLRVRLPVSQVVGRRVQLKRAGAEFKGLSPFKQERTPSFTVNDQKGFWHDFASGQHGSIIDFEMKITGCTFVEAVRNLASLAGLTTELEKHLGRNAGPSHRNGNGANGNGAHPHAPEPDAPPTGNAGHASARQIVATYDYRAADNSLVYQVCRVEWTEADGALHKSFMQRRPGPMSGDRQTWVWGLKAGIYVQGRDGDWRMVTDKRRPEKGQATITVEDDVDHGLYRLPDLLNEMEAAPDERAVIFSPEGEKDCDTLAAWGLVATDSSGGAKNWSPHHAEMLRGADVVILMDNDASGRTYGHAKAASLRGIAKRVRLLDWRDHWAHAPDKADITDWRDHGGGDLSKLFRILDRLPEWTPQPPDSAFNAVAFNQLDRPARELEWLVKRMWTRGEVSCTYGQPGCGKSFLMTDVALSIARGVSWMGLTTRRGLVIYYAGEGGLGLKRRLRAWRKSHNVAPDEDIPFVLLTSRLNLYESNKDVDGLIAEIKAWSAYYDTPLELLVIDTFSSAASGANENASEDVTKILDRCRRIATECTCHVAIVHHTPKGGGSPRGWSGILGNVESAIEVAETEEQDVEDLGDRRITRPVRRMRVTKQKDEVESTTRSFVLKQVTLATDTDGEPVTSCIVSQVQIGAERGLEVPHGFVALPPNNVLVMRALVLALRKHGRRPPEELETKAPIGADCVTVREWQDALVELRYAGPDPNDPDGKNLLARAKKAVERAFGEYNWTGRNLIGKHKEWVWRGTRKVLGIDRPPERVERPELSQEHVYAPGETPQSFQDLL